MSDSTASPGRKTRHWHKKILILVNLVFFGLAAGAVWVAISQERSHADGTPMQIAMNLAPSALPTKAPTISNCTTCHATDAMFSHPVKVTPTMQIPGDWPLANGQISCMTCHDTNINRHAGAMVKHDPLLRGSLKGAAFCTQCHQVDELGQATRHAGMPIHAHLRWPGKTEVQTPLHGRLDPESLTCLSCHDDTLAGDPTSQGSRLAGMSVSHPVGVLFADPRGPSEARRDMPLQLESALDPRIRLFDHQIGCNSCHSPYSPNPAHLVIMNDHSRLCLTCHVDH